MTIALAADTPSPWRVVVDVNESCNLRCAYCHIDAMFRPVDGDGRTLSPALFRRIAVECDALGVFELTLTGGEVFVMPEVSEYVRALQPLGFTSTQVITNGTLLTKATCGELAAAKLTRVSISIDGAGAANDVMRGKGVFGKAMRAVSNAVAAGLRVNVISVLGAHNYLVWDELTRMLRDEGARGHSLSLMCRLGRAERAASWQGVPQHALGELAAKVAAVQAELSGPDFSVFLNDGVLRPGGWTGIPTPIHVFQDANPGLEAVVMVDGSVVQNRLYGGRWPIGSVHAHTVQEIWQRSRHRRAQAVSATVDRAAGSLLPGIYYHFAPGTVAEAPDRIRAEVHGRPSRADRRYRARAESWGTAWFDTHTFCVGDLSVAARNT